MKTIAIIGSFRKHYEGIRILVRKLVEINICVLSPIGSDIINPDDKFVLFTTDNPDYTPIEVQMVTLDKILQAELVYVYNPDGYIGSTTAYEIGVCMSKRKDIYYMEKPEDLPVPFSMNQIMNPNDLVTNISDLSSCDLEYNLCRTATNSLNKIFNIESNTSHQDKKELIICGSMTFFEEMKKIQNELLQYDINAIIPKEEGDMFNDLDEISIIDFKRKVSNNYLKRIRNKRSTAVLILNEEKNGIENYIGPNTLVELAMAFIWYRKIFIYNDIYEPLKDELLAWNCVPLKKDLNKLVEYFIDIKKGNKENEQLDMFRFIGGR